MVSYLQMIWNLLRNYWLPSKIQDMTARLISPKEMTATLEYNCTMLLKCSTRESTTFMDLCGVKVIHNEIILSKDHNKCVACHSMSHQYMGVSQPTIMDCNRPGWVNHKYSTPVVQQPPKCLWCKYGHN